MANRFNTWLKNIHRSIDEILNLLPSKRSIVKSQNDLKVKKAVERTIEINGEAVHRNLKHRHTDIQVSTAQKIIETQ